MANEMEVRLDYTALDISVANKVRVQALTADIKKRMRRLREEVIEIGKSLIEAKELLGHGHFGNWLKMEFDWSQDTAERFMNVGRWANQIPQIAEFDLNKSVLYMLSASSTPEEAREFAVEYAETGEKITPTVASEIIEAHQPGKVVGLLGGSVVGEEDFSFTNNPNTQTPNKLPPSQASMTAEIREVLERIDEMLPFIDTEEGLLALEEELGETQDKIGGLMDVEDRDSFREWAIRLRRGIERAGNEMAVEEARTRVPGIVEEITEKLNGLGYSIENATSLQSLEAHREIFDQVEYKIFHQIYNPRTAQELEKKVKILESAIERKREQLTPTPISDEPKTGEVFSVYYISQASLEGLAKISSVQSISERGILKYC